MTSLNNLRKTSLSAAIAVSIALVGCGGGSDDPVVEEEVVVVPPAPTPVNYSYEVKVLNLTVAQPMSPLAVVLHNEGEFWKIGEAASVALENLAESGANTDFLADSMALASASGADLLMPGATETVTVTLVDTMPTSFTLATMLVNTNDAFAGITAKDISNLAVDESISLLTGSYDSGTEKNSELSATIPGPATGGMGEGFNEERDDVDVVSMHAGVVTIDDGLSQSVLTEEHRFDNPTLSITITRVE